MNETVEPAARLAQGAGRKGRHGSGRGRAGETEEALVNAGAVSHRDPDYDSRLEYCERKLGEVYDLMRLVCDELRVDTSPVDETVPMLRVIDGGRVD
jgi:hypothetical protein